MKRPITDFLVSGPCLGPFPVSNSVPSILPGRVWPGSRTVTPHSPDAVFVKQNERGLYEVVATEAEADAQVIYPAPLR
jgi:hypothetical protein